MDYMLFLGHHLSDSWPTILNILYKDPNAKIDIGNAPMDIQLYLGNTKDMKAKLQ